MADLSLPLLPPPALPSLLLQLALGGLTEDQVAALREQLDARLRAASEGSAPLPDAAAEAHGREVWTRCEALTAGERA
jgi:hypothetical protein